MLKHLDNYLPFVTFVATLVHGFITGFIYVHTSVLLFALIWILLNKYSVFKFAEQNDKIEERKLKERFLTENEFRVKVNNDIAAMQQKLNTLNLFPVKR